jgi:NCS1 family nucleobase:cation symporter-1
MYSTEDSSPYFYTKGFNIRAFGSWAAAIILVIPGVSGALHAGSIGEAAVHIYNLGFLLSTTVAAVLYYTSCKIWPVDLYPPQYADRPRAWESMRKTEGFFPEDSAIPSHLLEAAESTSVDNFKGI